VTLPLQEALDFDAVKLFLRRAERARPGFTLTEEMLPPVAESCRQLATFHAGFTRDAAREVAGVSPLILVSLVDKSLLRLGDTGRYDRHPLL